MERRRFLKSLVGAGVVAPYVHAQSVPDWGCPVLDTHLHLRRDPDACFTHMQGCGVTHAVLLSTITDQDRAKQEIEKRPPNTARAFHGAVSIGELKYHLAFHSPESYPQFDKILRAHPKTNFIGHADLLSCDLDFSRRFIIRHRSKLIFGSDCSCTDGKGAGISQSNNPEASRLAGKCVAAATFGLLKIDIARNAAEQTTSHCKER